MVAVIQQTITISMVAVPVAQRLVPIMEVATPQTTMTNTVAVPVAQRLVPIMEVATPQTITISTAVALVLLQQRQPTEAVPRQRTTMHTEAVSVQAMTGNFQ